MRLMSLKPTASAASGSPQSSIAMLARYSCMSGCRPFAGTLAHPACAVAWQSRRRFGIRVSCSEQGETEAQEAYIADWGQPDKLKKMKVALHVGYDGSSYRGLQINRENAESETVEHFLEDALYKVGGIRPSNFGDLTKIGWSRASRTDKGVHSLSSVVALKMQCPDDGARFLEDPEGIGMAKDINKYLPESIQVHSVQRVVKSFRARQLAADRRYEYFMPAHVIGIEGKDHEEDLRRLDLFRKALATFEGTHAFHNHTTTSLYSKENNDSRHAKRNVWRRQERDRKAKLAAEKDASATSEEGSHIYVCTGDLTYDKDVKSHPDDHISNTSDDAMTAKAVHADKHKEKQDEDVHRWDLSINFSWSKEHEKIIASSHYRHMRSLTASDVLYLSPDGEPAIKISLWGDSFMLHQIRKMVGTSVAVANGSFPLELASASLAPPGRVNLPMMLAETLVLTEINFFPFPEGYSGQKSPVVSLTGEQLRLRKGALEMRENFRERVLNTTLNKQLRHENWQIWAERVRSLKVDEKDLEDFLESHRVWEKEQQRRREEKQAKRRQQQKQKEEEEIRAAEVNEDVGPDHLQQEQT